MLDIFHSTSLLDSTMTYTKSESFDQLIRNATLVNCNSEISDEVRELDDKISTHTRHIQLQRSLDSLNRKNSLLDNRLSDLDSVIDSYRNNINSKHNQLQERRRNLARVSNQQQDGDSDEIERSVTLKVSVDQLKKQTKIQRIRLLKDLSVLFPIVKVDDSNNLTFSILGLSISENVISSTSHAQTSSALGYSCLLTCLLSKYLNVYLPYDIVYKGSQSVIIDPVSNIRGSNIFPLDLFFKKDQMYRFEYANYILNKNIEVVSRHFLLGTKTLINTPPLAHAIIQLTLTGT